MPRWSYINSELLKIKEGAFLWTVYSIYVDGIPLHDLTGQVIYRNSVA